MADHIDGTNDSTQQQVTQPVDNPTPDVNDGKNTDIQTMMAEMMAENKRLKKSLDKAASEAAGYKKQFMETKTVQEQAAIEKAEAEAKMRDELNALRKESTVNKFAKNFMALGYTEELAAQAAEAQYDGDVDTLFEVQKKYRNELTNSVRAQMMKDMPAPSIGNDDSITVTKEQFQKMSYPEMLKLKREHPSVYAQLTK